MQIALTGRRITADDALRGYLDDRLNRLAKHDPKVERVDVEICEEANPRLSDQKIKVEFAWHGQGRVVRSEAAAGHLQEAVDRGLSKLDARLRKAADRRRIHHGAHAPVSLAVATAQAATDPDPSA